MLSQIAAERPSFSRGLAEDDLVDRQSGKHSSDFQNRRGKAVGLEAGVSPSDTMAHAFIWMQRVQPVDESLVSPSVLTHVLIAVHQE